MESASLRVPSRMEEIPLTVISLYAFIVCVFLFICTPRQGSGLDGKSAAKVAI